MILLVMIGVWFGVHTLYVFAMSAKAAQEAGRLTLYWKINLAPAAVLGLILDFVFNYTFGWMYLAVPRPLLFTSTCKYHFRNGHGWRLRLAQFWAKQLNVFDDHIK
jgi:hypothetical protein